MNKEIDFETYLIISYGKFEIFLLDIKNHKDIYQEEFKFRDVSEKLDFNLLNDFLENNIFKIEKLAGNFVNNINIVIENKSILTSNIGIKKKNYTGEITDIILESMLTDVKDLFKENYNQYKLIHMIIDKYIIDGVSYSSLQDKISNDEIEETYVASQTEQIANLNQAMISMRAEIVLKDKKLKDLDKKKEALDLALERVRFKCFGPEASAVKKGKLMSVD